MQILFLLGLFLLVGGSPLEGRAATCTSAACYKAIVSAINVVADCSSFQLATITPCPVVATIYKTIPAKTVTQTYTKGQPFGRDVEVDLAKRAACTKAITSKATSIPAYATACKSLDLVGACSCLGIAPSTTTLPPGTSTLTSTVTPAPVTIVTTITPCPQPPASTTRTIITTITSTYTTTTTNTIRSTQSYIATSTKYTTVTPVSTASTTITQPPTTITAPPSTYTTVETETTSYYSIKVIFVDTTVTEYVEKRAIKTAGPLLAPRAACPTISFTTTSTSSKVVTSRVVTATTTTVTLSRTSTTVVTSTAPASTITTTFTEQPSTTVTPTTTVTSTSTITESDISTTYVTTPVTVYEHTGTTSTPDPTDTPEPTVTPQPTGPPPPGYTCTPVAPGGTETCYDGSTCQETARCVPDTDEPHCSGLCSQDSKCVGSLYNGNNNSCTIYGSCCAPPSGPPPDPNCKPSENIEPGNETCNDGSKCTDTVRCISNTDESRCYGYCAQDDHCIYGIYDGAQNSCNLIRYCCAEPYPK